MHSSMDYHCSWPAYEEPSHSMAEQGYFPAPMWHCPPSRCNANEGAPGSMDRPYFQNFRRTRSRQIRRNLFPSFCNSCSPDRKYQSHVTMFQDSYLRPGSRDSNFVFQQDAATKDHNEVSRLSEQSTPVRRRLEYCSPSVIWPAEELMNSNDDLYKFLYPINQYSNDEEKNFMHNSYSNCREIPINFVDSELSKTQIKSYSSPSLTAHHPNNSPKLTPVRKTKSQTNVCTKNNSEISASIINNQDPLLDILDSIKRGIIRTSETEKNEQTKEEQHEYLQENEIASAEKGSICGKTTFVQCHNSEIRERQIQNTQQYMDEASDSNGNSNQNYSVVITEKQKTNRQTNYHYANESELSKSEFLDPKKCDKIKIDTSSYDIPSDDKDFSIPNNQIRNQKDNGSNSEQTQLTYELTEMAIAFEADNPFPEWFMSLNEKDINSEYSSAELKKLKNISGLENNFTQDNINTSCSHFETLKNVTNELGTSDEFSMNEIEEQVPNNSTIRTNTSYSEKDFVRYQTEWTFSSQGKYWVDDPAITSSLILDNEDFEDLLSSCVAPDSVIPKDVFNAIKTKIRGRRKSVLTAIKSTDSSEDEMKKNNAPKKNPEGQQPDFKIHDLNDSQTQVTVKNEWTESYRHIDKQDGAGQWEDSQLDSSEHGYFERDKLKKDGLQNEIFSNYLLNEELHKFETECDEFNLKANYISVEEKSQIEANTLLRVNPDGELDPNAKLESIPRDSNPIQSDCVAQASDIYVDYPQNLKFLGDFTVTNHLDLIQTNQRNQIIKQDSQVCDRTQLKPISEKLVSNVLNSKNVLPSYQSEEEQNITNASSTLKPTKPRHYQARLSKMQAINFKVVSEGLMDDSVKEVDFSDSHTCRKQAEKPSAMLLAKPILKSNLRTKKKTNIFKAIRGSATRISAQPSFDSLKSSSDSSINVTSRRQKSIRSNEQREEMIISSDVLKNSGVAKVIENKNGTQLAIGEASPQTSRVLRKRKSQNSKNPASKQLKI